MKYLTFVVPCFNSQDYMERCINSLLVGGTDVEVIIIDDGSTDNTGKIANYYKNNFPEIVKVVHKRNAGHGSGINKGLEIAAGKYFKVVDSDDWIDRNAYLTLLRKIKYFCKIENKSDEVTMPDLFICNYIYDHKNEGKYKKVHYRNAFPVEKICDWNQMGHLGISQYLIMHSLVFRTKILISSGVKLPEYTFYVDNLFSNQPLSYVERIYYMDIDLYHYFLGREDQSVNSKNLMKRIDQQIFVTKLVIHCADLKQIRQKYPKLEKYLCRNMSIMMAISSIHLILICTPEAHCKRAELWNDVKNYDYKLYCKLRYFSLSGLTYLPGSLGDYCTIIGYRIAKRVFQFQ